MKKTYQLGENTKIHKIKYLCNNIFYERFTCDECYVIEVVNHDINKYHVIVGKDIGYGLIIVKRMKTYTSIDKAYNVFRKEIDPYLNNEERLRYDH